MIDRTELQDAAQKAFPRDTLVPDRDASWQMIADMGWLMIETAEERGGLGLDRSASATLHFELGRVLSPAPLIPALLGLMALDDEWAARAMGGEYIPLHMLPAAVDRDGQGRLSGSVGGMFDADMAAHAVVGGKGFYALVALDGPGVERVERRTWDDTRRIFDVVLDGCTPVTLLAEGEAARALHDRISPAAQVALAAECLGGASAALDLTVEYLKVRKQFDRPLAMFQALKHRCADLATRIAAAEALLWHRAADASAGIVACGAAKALAAEVYAAVAEEMIQLHGGIGLTAEHPCHLFMKRAMLNRQLCGSVEHWLEAAGRDAATAG